MDQSVGCGTLYDLRNGFKTLPGKHHYQMRAHAHHQSLSEETSGVIISNAELCTSGLSKF